MEQVKEISIDSELFKPLRGEFDSILNHTIEYMMQKGTHEASMSVKLNIEIHDVVLDTDDGKEHVFAPSFAHEINSVVQVKEKSRGSVEGEYKLIQNADTKNWGISKIDSGQISMFDEPVEEAGEQYNETLFSHLKQFINDDMVIINNDGEYELMDMTAIPPELIASTDLNIGNDNRLITLASECLAQHEGHHITCTGELTEDGLDYKSLAIVCEDCGEILVKVFSDITE